MKPILFSLFLGCFLVASSPLLATAWRVNNGLTAPNQVDFTELKTAVESPTVQSGDTIYLEGSSIVYEGQVEVRKRLVILGPGYLLDQPQVQPTLCNQLPATIGFGSAGLDFYPGSDGSVLSGVTLEGQFYLRGVSNILIARNRIDNLVIGTDNAGNNVNSNIEIVQNLICNDINPFGSSTVVNGLYIANNLIGRGIDFFVDGASNVTIINNILRPSGYIEAEGATISFNYVGRIESSTQNVSITNNILSQNNQDNQDIVALNGTNAIDPYDGAFMNCNTDDWRLQPADQTTTHGAYNGPLPLYANPDFLGNLPAIPAIYECEVDACGDESINVSFKVRSNQ